MLEGAILEGLRFAGGFVVAAGVRRSDDVGVGLELDMVETTVIDGKGLLKPSGDMHYAVLTPESVCDAAFEWLKVAWQCGGRDE